MTTANCKQPNGIPAVAYLRKSTAGQRADGKEKQEKSIPQQTAEVGKLKPEDGGDYQIVRSYADPGKSGWKRGAARPDFTRMLTDCQQRRDVQAILVDDLDRFSRSDPMEVMSDLQALRSAGVRWIHACNQGTYQLGDGADIGQLIKLTVEAWSSNQFCAKLGRRVAIARRNRAKEGKRTGGPAPFGLANDGDGGLIPGDADDIATVGRIFDLFVNHHLSFNRIAAVLNSEGIPAPQGGVWFRRSVATILRQVAYSGRFESSGQACGKFYRIGDDGEVVESNGEERTKREPVFHEDNRYAPIIDQKLFDRAQKRLATLKAGPKQRRNAYALSGGILRCDHCGGPLVAMQKNGGTVYYRCVSSSDPLRDCSSFSIREDQILPAVLRLVDDEFSALLAESLDHRPPTVAKPNHEARIKKLQQQIDRYVARILDIEDAETRQQCDAKIKALRTELAALQAEQMSPASKEAEQEEAKRLFDWWQEKKKSIVSVSIDAESKLAQTKYPNTSAYVAVWGDDAFPVDLDKTAINEILWSLGAEIRLRWRTEQRPLRCRHFVEKGRFRLGQRSGQLVLNGMYAKPRNPSL